MKPLPLNRLLMLQMGYAFAGNYVQRRQNETREGRALNRRVVIVLDGKLTD